jgi:membrane-associated phospholipid phosphatase
MTRAQRNLLWIAVWLAAIAVATSLDAKVALFMRAHGSEEYFKTHRPAEQILKAPGEFYFTIIAGLVIVALHPFRWRAGGFVLLGTTVSAANWVIKWMVGRFRPFKVGNGDLPHPFDFQPFTGGWLGGYYTRNLCFPSGHAALAFATAAAVAMLWPTARWRGWAFVVATIVAAQRVAENAHWLSDTVAAAALGIGGVHLIARIVKRFVPVEATSDAVDPTRLTHDSSLPLSGHPLLQRTGERSDASPTR